MLNVPTEVQALFKTDSVFKNFHVHFPNGENADLTNDDIVSESVSFTESICSAQVFQFGLSERSQIEFECVGVQNIYGMTIECAIEICVDSLGASWISDHAPTGNEDFLDLQVCTYDGRNMYRVPYGRFIVESCPRSQGAMKHRRVTAYSVAGDKAELTASTQAKFAMVTSDETIKQNMLLLAAEQMKSVTGLTLTETVLGSSAFTVTTTEETLPLYETGGIYVYRDTLRATVTRMTLTDSTVIQSISKLLRFTSDADPSFFDDVSAYMKEHYPSYATGAEMFWKVRLHYSPDISASVANNVFLNSDDSLYVYPYYGEAQKPELSFVTAVTNMRITRISEGSQSTVISFGDAGTFITDYALNVYELTDTAQALMNITVKGTGYESISIGVGEKQNYYSYTDTLNATDLYNGFLELFGSFGKVSRSGDIETLVISQSEPVAMTPAEYSELWWDEYDVESVGTVTYKYYDTPTSSELVGTYTLTGGGASTYQMNNNYALLNLSVTPTEAGTETVAEFVNQILASLFVPKLPDINFTPVTLDAIGLPYIEAGDYLEIDDADDGTVGTYVLSRTLSGIQVLTDSIESKGGEVLGNGS